MRRSSFSAKNNNAASDKLSYDILAFGQVG